MLILPDCKWTVFTVVIFCNTQGETANLAPLARQMDRNEIWFLPSTERVQNPLASLYKSHFALDERHQSET